MSWSLRFLLISCVLLAPALIALKLEFTKPALHLHRDRRLLLSLSVALRPGATRVMGRRAALASSAALLIPAAGFATVINAPKTLAEIQSEGREDRQAAGLPGLEELVAKTVARQESQLGRPLSEAEVAAITVCACHQLAQCLLRGLILPCMAGKDQGGVLQSRGDRARARNRVRG